MKKLSKVLVLLGMVAISFIYGSEDTVPRPLLREVSQKNPNRIYFGPEVFLFDLDTHFKGITVKGSKFFLGLGLSYEYRKPAAFYFGIDLLSAVGKNCFNESYKGSPFPKSSGFTGFGHVELKLGYTLSPEKWLVTPFLGAGAYNFGYENSNHRFKGGMSYLAGGLRSQYEVAPGFNVGLNIKILGSIGTFEEFKLYTLKLTNHHGLWGGEIGIPIAWLIGSKNRWDIQLEPYFLNLDFSQVQNIYGTRLLFGYHF